MSNPRTGGDIKYISRAYTPVSNDSDIGIVEFVIKTYYKEQHPRFPDGGWLTQYMDKMQLGDTLDFRGPTGKIIYERDGVFTIHGEKKQYTNIGCITGGSGVTPCFQLMKYAVQNSEPLSISMLYANQTPKDILLRDELDALSTKGMKTAYTVDRLNDGEAWDGYIGFINEQMVIDSLPPPGDNTIILVCGPPVAIAKCWKPICDKLGYTMVEF
jgi:cytochrome-b5 reductase